MSKWNKINWYCADCGEYWMTTENCAPCAQINSWCHCSCRTNCKGERKADFTALAIPKCHECEQDLQFGIDLCAHVENRSQAV
ncbi:MAG: hypothetical protein A2X94_17615 [Bdellovibrionales bacterium GWB1_55_8]|nr:MAG: hypothetical protein A2X94_17615 [Bdellovibrionales bacterium GWB1_55_8]